MMKAIALVSLIWGVPQAYADAPRTVLFGATLELTTTSVPVDHLASSYTAFGYVQTDLNRSSGVITLPGLLLSGYIERSESDAPINWAKPASAKLKGNEFVLFWLADDLMQLKHPASIVVSTGSLRAIRINPALIKRISKRSLKLDGYKAHRQPFYMPLAHAQCLSDSAPNYQCGAKYTYNGIWISCNSEVGEKELSTLCARGFSNRPSENEINAIVSKGNVFFLGLADE